MNEDFLQYIWRFQKFNTSVLQTTEGEAVQVIATGLQNRNAGPDFLNARVRIGDTLWAGNVEIHTEAADWFKHKHQDDRAYDNVVLHVVYTNNAEVKNFNGEVIPTLCIKDLFDFQTWRYYKSWLKMDTFIPCENLVVNVPDIVKSATVQAAAADRLQEKSNLCLDYLNETSGDLESALYRVLMRAFGLKVNALPFEQLARATPFTLLRKLWSDRVELEALLLGQAGFLDGKSDGHRHVADLEARYAFQQRKFGIEPMPKSAWKLFRLRPPNFPQVRLAQIASFYHKHGAVAQKIIDFKEIESLHMLFDIQLEGDFWNTHYTLEKQSPIAPKHIGEATKSVLVVNAIVPFLFALSRFSHDDEYADTAVKILEQLPGERNEVVRKFSNLGFKTINAFDSQGLIQLKKIGCDERKCLNCKTGIYLLDHYEKSS